MADKPPAATGAEPAENGAEAAGAAAADSTDPKAGSEVGLDVAVGKDGAPILDAAAKDAVPAEAAAQAEKKEDAAAGAEAAAAEAEKKEGDEDDEEEEAGQGVKKKAGWLSFLSGGASGGDSSAKDADHRKRTWELTIGLTSMLNVTMEENLRVFFCVSVGNERHRGQYIKGCQPKFTPVYNLKKKEPWSLDVPLLIHDRKRMKLSYRELSKYAVMVDMWQVSRFTFNVYYGVAKKTFAQLCTKEAGQTLIMCRKHNRTQMADKKQRKLKFDVATFDCIIQFEEYYKFVLHGEHWSMDMAKYDHQCGENGEKEFKAREKKRKRLWFQVPPNKNVLVDRPGLGLIGGKPQTNFVKWNNKEDSAFWNEVGTYSFKGTRTDLKQSYFIVTVYMGNPSQHTVDNPLLQGTNPALSHSSQLGKALLTFTSIMDITVLKAVVKKLSGCSMEPVADLTGNMKCKELSMGMKLGDVDSGTARFTKLYSPGQPQVSGTVTHLNKNEKYLVVNVKQCRNLPMSQPEKGTSNPYLKCKFDNMEQRCPKMMETLRPIFNFRFYFPVRSVYMEKLKKKSKDQEKLWIAELLTKGTLTIQIWDDDIASSDFLGGVTVDIADIVASKTKEDRNMLGEVKTVVKNEDDDDDPVPEGKKQWYQEPERTRIYDCKSSGLSLSGSSLTGTTGVPSIYFEAYFYSDITVVKEMPEPSSGGPTEDKFWLALGKEFDFQNKMFQQDEYVIPFPNAVGAKDSQPKNPSNPVGEQLRRFTSMAVDPYGDGPDDLAPLMRFLTPIIVPESLSHPSDKIHWINCLSWEPTSNKQLKQGLIPQDGWKDPSFILQTRKGASQDHALVLCSLLMGSNQDAYVVKGTIYATLPAAEGQPEHLQLVEHCWVMTREDGWVTFWEPMNGKVYHLPKRWTPPTKEEVEEKATKKKKKAKAEAEEEGDPNEEEPERPAELMWEGEAPDSKVDQEAIDALPTTRRQPKAKVKVGAGRRAEIDVSAEKKAQIIKDRESLSVAPCKEMLDKEKTLVNNLPYDSIDVVFNDRNVFANRQNHHPALIKYDFPEPEDKFEKGNQWFKYVTPRDLKEMAKASIEIDPVGDKNVSLSRPLDSDKAAQLRIDIVKELEENLRLYRSKLGYDCNIINLPYVLKEIENFLYMQELIATLDPDAISKKGRDTSSGGTGPGKSEVSFKDPLNEEYMKKLLKQVPTFANGKSPTSNLQGSPWMESTMTRYDSYRQEMKKRYEKLEKMIDDFREKKEDFPVARNKEFKGLTVHFCTSEVEDMRSYLMELAGYKELINVGHDSIDYAIQAIVVPLSAGVQSVWVFVGAQEKGEEKEDKKK